MRFCTSILLFVALSIPAYSQQSNPKSIGTNPEAENILLSAVDENEFMGASAGFLVDGKILWAAGAGYSDAAQKTAYDASTATRIASISKPMTAIAIMQLFEAGKLDLEAPIQQYLPDFPVKKEGSITVRHLLSHSGGIGAYASGRERENKKQYSSLADASNIFKNRKLLDAPGTAFNYSSYGYVLLGQIIEQASGMSYEAYMKKHIWEKAGMLHTGIVEWGKPVPNQAVLYHRNSKGKIKKAAETNLSDRIPGGGIYSCATDLLHFGNAVLNNTLIKESSLQMMVEDSGLKKEGSGYGLGWYLYGENPTYGHVFGHNGGQTGASTFLFLLPAENTAIVVLSSTSGALQSVSNIAVKLFDVAAAAKK